MFLNKSKTKSIVKQLDRVNSKRAPVTVGNKLKSLCIVEVDEHKFDRKKIKKLSALLKVKEKDIVFRSFVKTKSKEDKENPVLFSPKDIGWRGVFKTPSLKELNKVNFDIIISYYTEDNITLNAVSSLTKGKFKVGLRENAYQAHDLSLEVKVGETDIFLSELEKYLKILKIL